MALYVVLRHPKNPEQTWSNVWQSDDRLVDGIMTNGDVAPLCEAAQRSGQYVYVHRCTWGGVSAEITSRTKVQNVSKVDRDYYISFATPEPVAAVPHVQPLRGQDYYFAAASEGL
jgi:hypothetical protein